MVFFHFSLPDKPCTQTHINATSKCLAKKKVNIETRSTLITWKTGINSQYSNCINLKVILDLLIKLFWTSENNERNVRYLHIHAKRIKIISVHYFSPILVHCSRNMNVYVHRIQGIAVGIINIEKENVHIQCKLHISKTKVNLNATHKFMARQYTLFHSLCSNAIYWRLLNCYSCRI